MGQYHRSGSVSPCLEWWVGSIQELFHLATVSSIWSMRLPSASMRCTSFRASTDHPTEPKREWRILPGAQSLGVDTLSMHMQEPRAIDDTQAVNWASCKWSMYAAGCKPFEVGQPDSGLDVRVWPSRGGRERCHPFPAHRSMQWSPRGPTSHWLDPRGTTGANSACPQQGRGFDPRGTDGTNRAPSCYPRHRLASTDVYVPFADRERLSPVFEFAPLRPTMERVTAATLGKPIR